MRVLVCGSRDWTDEHMVEAVLTGLWEENWHDLGVIEGGARGADRWASNFAKAYDFQHLTFPADWDKHGKAAGPIRNQQMLDEGKPELVVAFKDGFRHDTVAEGKIVGRAQGGTEDMVRRAKAAGIPVWIMSHG